jgi:hypothetical protein
MSTVQQSFGRIVNVKIFATIATTPQNFNNGFGFNIENSNKYTLFSSVQADGSPGFRIRGKIQKMETAITHTVNFGTIFIYNLGPSSRALIESQLLTNIIIEAGYGEHAKQVLVGRTVWARTYKQGPDYITELVAQDGIFSGVNAAIYQNYKGPVTYQQVVDICLAALNDAGIRTGTISEIPEGGYQNSLMLVGDPFDALNRTCVKLGLYCSIQNGVVNIRGFGEPLGTPVISLDETTGLIGIPELRAQSLLGAIPPTTPGGKIVLQTPTNGLSFKCLLRPEIEVGSQVRILSKFVKGLYIAAKIVHDFDSWEGPFYTDCECSN